MYNTVRLCDIIQKDTYMYNFVRLSNNTMPHGNNNRLRSCNSQVKALYHKAMARSHSKCNQQQKAKDVIGSKTNIFLESLGVANSREGISIQATGMEDNKEYWVCKTFKIRIDTAVAQ